MVVMGLLITLEDKPLINLAPNYYRQLCRQERSVELLVPQHNIMRPNDTNSDFIPSLTSSFQKSFKNRQDEWRLNKNYLKLLFWTFRPSKSAKKSREQSWFLSIFYRTHQQQNLAVSFCTNCCQCPIIVEWQVSLQGTTIFRIEIPTHKHNRLGWTTIEIAECPWQETDSCARLTHTHAHTPHIYTQTGGSRLIRMWIIQIPAWIYKSKPFKITFQSLIC